MIIVGLGNPGLKYKDTYHNMGYGVVEAIAEKLGKKINKIEADSLTAVTEYHGKKLIIAKPLTYMNLSGTAVKGLLKKYGEDESGLIVCYDDIDIDRFRVRVRGSGSAGTHNGMRNIIQELNSTNFVRLRVGIGRDEGDLKDYVLKKTAKEDRKKFQEIFSRCADIILEYAAGGDIDKLMREGNIIE